MRNLRYVSASGEEFELDAPEATVGRALPLFSRALSYELGYRGVSAVSRDAREVSLEARVSDWAEVDRMRRAFDADAEAATPGTLVYCGEWEASALVMACETTDVSRGVISLEMTVVLTDGVWRRWRTTSFVPSSGTGDIGLDYPHGYPYDYASSGRRSDLDGCPWAACPVRITVYGPAQDPYVKIGGNRYQVEVTVPAGAVLEIDGAAKTIRLVSSSGAVTDCFAQGVRGSGAGSGEYVFERVPAGQSAVTWDGTFGFDVSACDEDTEPPWTE